MRLVPDITRIIRLLPVFALVLGACDGTSVNQTVGGDISVIDPNAMPIRRLGIISLSRINDSQTGTSIDATFARFDHALAADLTVATTIPTLDTCSTSGDFDVLGSRGLAPGFLPGPYTTTEFELVGAGEAITFTAPAGTWLTLSRDQGTDDLGYVTSTPPPPAGLVLDVPGDGFLAFPNMPIADVKSLDALLVIVNSVREKVPER